MSLLFCESFDDGLSALGKWDAFAVNQLSGSFGRHGSGIKLQASGNRLVKRIAAADESATIIVGTAVRLDSLARTMIIQLLSDTAATVHISIENSPADYSLNIYKGQTGTLLGNVACGASIWHYVEVKCLLSDTVGTVEVRVDNRVVFTFSGDTKNGGTKTTFDAFSIGPGNISNVGNVAIDDVYLCNDAGAVNNDFLGDCRVDVLLPDGNGNYSQLVGSDADSTDNYLLVDEAAPNTTDYVGVGAVNGDIDTYAFAALPTGSAGIAGVFHRQYAATSDAGARSVRSVARVAATDYPGADLALASTYGVQSTLWELNPNTSALWTPTEVNAAEFGSEARA